MIDGHKTKREWKIQFTLAVNFISSKDFNEVWTMYLKRNNTEIMIAYETDKIIEEPFKSFLQKYKKGLEKRMKGSELVLDSVDIL